MTSSRGVKEKIEINKLDLEKNIEEKNVNIFRQNFSAPNKEESDDKMIPSVKRRLPKKIILVIGLAVGCFLLGLSLPFLFQRGVPAHVVDDGEVLGPRALRRDMTRWENKRKWSHRVESVLRDLYISVKTTKRYHYPRLTLLLETWVSLVQEQTWFFTDASDPEMYERSDGHTIITNCSSAHSRTALACKMGVEFDYFLKSRKRWWCHFDDDNYVHVRRLAEILSQYPASYPYYLGKPSTAKPLEVMDSMTSENQTSHFWFATGGAGFCVTRTMALKMAPYSAGGKFVETGNKFWFPDDVTFGYIVEHLIGERLTVIPEFHSHLESMKSVKEETLDDQITVSYINYNGVENVIDIPGPFSEDVDPTRFYSLHCRLYDAIYCPKKEIRRK